MKSEEQYASLDLEIHKDTQHAVHILINTVMFLPLNNRVDEVIAYFIFWQILDNIAQPINEIVTTYKPYVGGGG